MRGGSRWVAWTRRSTTRCTAARSRWQMLGAPWPDVQDAYLRAWEFRPTRAEPLYAIAFAYRIAQRYQLGYLFAKRAAEIPFPDGQLFVRCGSLRLRAIDEQAVCASWIGKHARRSRCAGACWPDPTSPTTIGNGLRATATVSVPAMIDAASHVPRCAGAAQPGRRSSATAEVIVSLVAGPDRDSTEQTLNSFLNCCLDVARVGRFLVVDAGLSAQDRATLRERYGFLEFADPGSATGPGPARAAPRSDRRTVLAASGPGLAVFCPGESHHPPDRRCSKPNHRCSRWVSTSPTRSS